MEGVKPQPQSSNNDSFAMTCVTKQILPDVSITKCVGSLGDAVIHGGDGKGEKPSKQPDKKPNAMEDVPKKAVPLDQAKPGPSIREALEEYINPKKVDEK